MNHTSHMQEMANEKHQAEVAKRGADVMPFNLHDTRHHFVKNADGGIQQVVARLSDDVNQVQLVRAHLREIQEQFLQGDFSGPAHIHGNDMPGLQQLQESEPGEIEITYKDVESGAELKLFHVECGASDCITHCGLMLSFRTMARMRVRIMP